LQAEFFKDEKLKELYYDEMLGTECIAVFMNAGQNYPLLKGQQTNLYKCVLENGFNRIYYDCVCDDGIWSHRSIFSRIISYKN
jgi:hypothetical protein